MIDFDKLRAIASEIAVIAVGHMVSQFDSSGNPSVIREYSSVKEPPYPFVTYDVRHVSSTNQRATNQYFDADGKKWHEFTENIDIKYCAKGDRSQEIISELCSQVKLPYFRDRVSLRMPGLSIQTIMPIKPAPTVQGTQYIEEHSFIIRCLLVNKVRDPYDLQMEGIDLTASFSNCVTTSTINVDIPITPDIL